MSLTGKAASGAVWTITTGLLARVVGLVGTVVITHYLAPSVLGEVAAATVLAFTANWISHWGFNQYVVVKGHEHQDALFHVTVLHLSVGAVALVSVVALADRFTEMFNAPNLGMYLPGMVLAVAIKRVASVPDKLLMREMRFRVVAIASALGELTYVGTAVLLVVTTNLGGQAIVLANILQAIVAAAIEIGAAGWRRWLTPTPWNWTRVREILRFGAPLGVETILSEAGRYWDKLMFSRLFGPHDTGIYSLSYNLSNVPAVYVGEHVATVLFPTMVQIAPEDRHRVFCQACGLLALVAWPMGFGLASVADTLVGVVLPPEWQDVSSFLVVLAAMAVFMPLNSVIASLLIATERTVALMVVEGAKMTLLLGGMWLLSGLGEVAAAAAVGVALLFQFTVALTLMTTRGFPASRLLAELRGPLIACLFIPAAVLGLRAAFLAWAQVPLLLQLFAEIAAGALAYLAGALLFARASLVQLLEIVRRQLRSRAVRSV